MRGISDEELLELIRKGMDTAKVAAGDRRVTRKRLERFFDRLRAVIKAKAGKPPSPAPGGGVLIYTDGASRGNPGRAGIGVVICDRKQNVLEEISEYIGEATNNVAEYRALIRGVEKALEYCPKEVDIFCDSELLVKQLNGQYKVRAPSILPLHKEAKGLVAKLPKWKIRHIRREKNVLADALANKAIDTRSD